MQIQIKTERNQISKKHEKKREETIKRNPRKEKKK